MDHTGTPNDDSTANDRSEQVNPCKTVFEVNINDAFHIAATVDTVEEALARARQFFKAPETDNVTIARVLVVSQ